MLNLDVNIYCIRIWVTSRDLGPAEHLWKQRHHGLPVCASFRSLVELYTHVERIPL